MILKIQIIGSCILAVLAVSASARDNPWVLWYDRPAAEWVEALPVGNGQLGAMVFGGVEKERIQFNHDTLWAGGPRDYAREGAAECLPEIRRLLFEGKQGEAERLAMERFMSVPLRQMPYQPFGDLRLFFPGQDEFGRYRRDLDLDTAIAGVRYTSGGITFTREVFASRPGGMIVVRIEADRPGAVRLSATIDSPLPGASACKLGEGTIALRGGPWKYRMPRTGQELDCVLRYEARLHATIEGGSMATADDRIEILGADSATLELCAATSYRDYGDVGGDPAVICAGILADAAGRPFGALRKAHVADHQGLFRRVHLDLGSTKEASLPTDRRIRAFAEGGDPQLAALYFQYARYLMIAGSRPGTQPLNLQGLWNESMNPPWESKYTTNINAEMNYWPAEVCNLAECHEPLFDVLEELVLSGRRTAEAHYGCRGWVLHHNFDLWRGTAPINHSNHGIWPTGGAWLCQHLWWHYDFGRDERFLAERAYPVMKEAALFFSDFLVEDPRSEEGLLISTPSNSPENGGLVAGPTMDHQIIRDLFAHCIEASRILGVDEDLRERLIAIRGRIAPNRIGRLGQLQEWLEDRDDPENKHRHVSHLWGLHPGNEITPRGTPDLCAAARRSLEFRGDGGTGWSKAWKVNLRARLGDGNHAYRMLEELIAKSTLPNLFDTHPPFQIDGNFGGASGIAEMLLQSHAGEIALLPALPDAWKRGKVSGLRARGGVDVSIAWAGGKAISARLNTRIEGVLKVRPPKGQKITEVRSRSTYIGYDAAEDAVLLDAEAGKTYDLIFK